MAVDDHFRWVNPHKVDHREAARVLGGFLLIIPLAYGDEAAIVIWREAVWDVQSAQPPLRPLPWRRWLPARVLKMSLALGHPLEQSAPMNFWPSGRVGAQRRVPVPDVMRLHVPGNRLVVLVGWSIHTVRASQVAGNADNALGVYRQDWLGVLCGRRWLPRWPNWGLHVIQGCPLTNVIICWQGCPSTAWRLCWRRWLPIGHDWGERGRGG